MKVSNCIKELWKHGYFSEERSATETETKIFDTFGVTCSNIHQQIKSAKKFLRKRGNGWIQKKPYNASKEEQPQSIDYFTMLRIHPEVRKVCEALFLNQHYKQSVLEAFILYDNFVKSKSRLTVDGKDLMMKAFKEQDPLIKIADLRTTTGRNKQEGIKYISAGSILFLRNPKAHENFILADPIAAIRYIAMASMLYEIVEKAS